MIPMAQVAAVSAHSGVIVRVANLLFYDQLKPFGSHPLLNQLILIQCRPSSFLD